MMAARCHDPSASGTLTSCASSSTCAGGMCVSGSCSRSGVAYGALAIALPNAVA